MNLTLILLLQCVGQIKQGQYCITQVNRLRLDQLKQIKLFSILINNYNSSVDQQVQLSSYQCSTHQPPPSPSSRPHSCNRSPPSSASGPNPSTDCSTHQEQMSKLTQQLQHQKRIKNNLLTVEKQHHDEIKQNQLRLKKKLEGFQKQKQIKMEQKIQQYKLNDQKWSKKIQHIESKFRHQNRQAIQKAQKYRQQSQDYFRSKQLPFHSARGSTSHKINMHKTQHRDNSNSSLLNKTGLDNSFTKRNKYMLMKVDTLGEKDFLEMGNNYSVAGSVVKTNGKTIDIDREISRHKQKSQQLQKQRQMAVFQNAMKRLARIQMTRRRVQKSKQVQKSPTEIRKPKHRILQDQQQDPYSSTTHHRPIVSKSKQSLLDSSIQSHIKAKRLLEQQQFNQRQLLVQNEQKRKRKSKILKAIKNKIKDIKNSTIKMQTLE